MRITPLILALLTGCTSTLPEPTMLQSHERLIMHDTYAQLEQACGGHEHCKEWGAFARIKDDGSCDIHMTWEMPRSAMPEVFAHEQQHCRGKHNHDRHGNPVH